MSVNCRISLNGHVARQQVYSLVASPHVFWLCGNCIFSGAFFFFLTQWYLELHQSASLTEAFYLFFSEIVKIHRSVSIFCLDHSDLLSYLIQNS